MFYTVAVSPGGPALFFGTRQRETRKNLQKAKERQTNESVFPVGDGTGLPTPHPTVQTEAAALFGHSRFPFEQRLHPHMAAGYGSHPFPASGMGPHCPNPVRLAGRRLKFLSKKSARSLCSGHFCLFLLENVLAHLTNWADPALGNLFPGSAGGHAVVRITHGGVIDVPAGAYVLIHKPYLFLKTFQPAVLCPALSGFETAFKGTRPPVLRNLI